MTIVHPTLRTYVTNDRAGPDNERHLRLGRLETFGSVGGARTTESRSSLPKVSTSTFDSSFTPWYSDGSKHRARVRVVASAVSSRTVCSNTWLPRLRRTC
jgi:hypothetical protein